MTHIAQGGWSVVVVNLCKGDVIFRHKFIKIQVTQISMKAVAERISNVLP